MKSWDKEELRKRIRECPKSLYKLPLTEIQKEIAPEYVYQTFRTYWIKIRG